MRSRVLAVLALVLLCVFVFCAAAPVSVSPRELPVGGFGGGKFIYTDVIGSRVCVAAGNTLWSFDSDAGDVCTISPSAQMRCCLVSGGSAFFICDNGSSFSFEEHSVYGGLIRSCPDVIDPSLYGYVTSMLADGDGGLWFVVRDKELYYCDGSGDKAVPVHKFGKTVTGLHWVKGQLYVACGSTVYCCEGKEEADFSSRVELASKPMRFFSQDVYVDHSGNFCSGSSVLFSSVVPDNNAVSHAFDGSHAFYQASDNTALQVDLYGNEIKEYRTEGLICAVCREGLITVKDGELCYAAFDSAPEPTATPSPTKAPEDDRAELPVDMEVFIAQEGDTVTDITSKNNCQVWYKGKMITSGTIRTGMSLRTDSGEIPVVITGDVNGSGTVNSADLRALQDHLLGLEKLTGPYLAAADISGNGSVGTEDTVLILKKF